MTLLSSLNIVQVDTAALKVRGIDTMRQKLLSSIADQIALAEAQATGQTYSRTKYKRVKSGDTVIDMPVAIRVRPWWMVDKDGSQLVSIKYGNQVLELQKGKKSIRIKSKDELVKTFLTVSEAVRAGELDEQINAAVSGFKTRFTKG